MNTYATQFRSSYGRAPFVKAEADLRNAMNSFRLATEAARMDSFLALYGAYVRMECVGVGNDADAATRTGLLNMVRPIVLAPDGPTRTT